MIKNIIFDLGDVLINLDKTAVPGQLLKYGLDPMDAGLFQLAHKYELGLITTTAFLDSLSRRTGVKDRRELMHAWNATIRELPEARLKFLEALRDTGDHRMFLLSNTNELHIEFIKEQLGTVRFGRLRGCFEGFYLSHELKLSKPDPTIFRHVVDVNGLRVAETLFIDDTEEHTRGAASIGLNTWHLQVGSESILELPKRL